MTQDLSDKIIANGIYATGNIVIMSSIPEPDRADSDSVGTKWTVTEQY